MVAIIFTTGSKYRAAPHIIVIIFIIGTRYACNDSMVAICYKEDQIWLQSSILAIIFGPIWKRLQSYIVPYIAKIAFIFGLFCDQDCNHIWSLSLLSLQSYWVLIMKIIAIICRPGLFVCILIIMKR